MLRLIFFLIIFGAMINAFSFDGPETSSLEQNNIKKTDNASSIEKPFSVSFQEPTIIHGLRCLNNSNGQKLFIGINEGAQSGDFINQSRSGIFFKEGSETNIRVSENDFHFFFYQRYYDNVRLNREDLTLTTKKDYGPNLGIAFDTFRCVTIEVSVFQIHRQKFLDWRRNEERQLNDDRQRRLNSRAL